MDFLLVYIVCGFFIGICIGLIIFLITTLVFFRDFANKIEKTKENQYGDKK